jgi:hypothetical protein
MTRKNFEMIAAVFAKQLDIHRAFSEPIGEAAVTDTARAMADQLQRENPRFDRHRFLTACGVEGFIAS